MKYDIDWKLFIQFYNQMSEYCSEHEALDIIKEVYGVPQ